MLPLRDDQPSYSTAYVTYFLIGLNLLIYLFEAMLDPKSLNSLIFQFGIVPSHLDRISVRLAEVSLNRGRASLLHFHVSARGLDACDREHVVSCTFLATTLRITWTL